MIERLAVFAATLMLLLLVFGVPDGIAADRPEQWRALVERVLPDEDTDAVMRILRCESYGDPNAARLETWGQYSIGLMQVNEGWLDGWGKAGDPAWAIPSHDGTPVELTDPTQNMMAAKWIRHLEDAAGMAPWSNWACRP